MISLKSSYFQEKSQGVLRTFTVYGDRFSVAQRSRKFLLAYFLPALLLSLGGLILYFPLSKHSTNAGFLVFTACILVYLCVARLISKQKMEITVDQSQGLKVDEYVYPPDDIRSLSISRLKTALDDAGSSHISVVLPTGEQQLSPYIDKELAKQLLGDLKQAIGSIQEK